MRQRKLIGGCMATFHMIHRLKKIRIIPKRAGHRAQATDMLGMIPSRVVTAAVCV